VDFYKILIENETYDGIQYKTGLNINLDGWIYFARENIFECYGTWLRKVIIPEGEDVSISPDKSNLYRAHRVILGERRRINIDVIYELIREGASIIDNEQISMLVNRYRYYGVVDLLVKSNIEVHTFHNQLISQANQNGYHPIGRFLENQMGRC